MKCEMCGNQAEVVVQWPASKPQKHKVCDPCAGEIWNTLSNKFSGTEAFYGFCIEPIEVGL